MTNPNLNYRTAEAYPGLALPDTAPRLTLRERLQNGALALHGETGLVLTLMLIGLVAQGLNMFNYPAFTLLDDEGIYAAQARAVIEQHALTPYTYFYDHAPVGWLLIAGWTLLTGGLHTFGTSIDSGRVLMLLFHLGMIPLLYNVARKLGCNALTAAFATLLFSLSPLAVFYQRLELLDNIMLFFVLLSMDLLLDGWGRMSRQVLSGLCFGIALLCKETAIFLVPALLLLAYRQRWNHHGKFALGVWALPALLLVSYYPLYALLKGELFPTGQNFVQAGDRIGGGTASGVSLMDALIWQSSRGGGGMFNLGNDFWQLVRTDWLPRDTFLLVGGFVAALANLYRGLRSDRRALVVSLLGLLSLFYLARGGIVLNYYILLAIPFLALNIGLALTPFLEWAWRKRPVGDRGSLALLAGPVLLAGYWLGGSLTPLYAENPSTAGRDAISWIKQNVPTDSKMVIRDDLWPDLHEEGLGGLGFPNAHSHWKVGTDPAIRDGVFHNDWHNVDYLLMSPDLEKSFAASGDQVALQAFQHSHLVKSWVAAPGDKTLHPQQIIQLYKVDKTGGLDTQTLKASDAYLRQHFDKNGAYTNPDGSVTSDSQANALLRAVWSGDRAEFNRVWQWTQANLVNSEGLLNWQWQPGRAAVAQTSADADTDAALALLLAGKRWNDPNLLAAGQKMAGAIWQHEVAEVNGRPYLLAGDWANRGETLAVNPGYFAPYAYRIFAEVDHSHDWQSLINSGYQLLFDSAKAPLGQNRSAGLPPDWIGVQRSNGQLVPLKLDSQDTTRYGYEAPRTYWRVALDGRWSNDQRATTFLKQAGFLRDEVNQTLQDGITHKDRVSAVYGHNGQVIEESPSLVGTTGAIAALNTLDPAAASLLYASQVLGSYQRDPQGLYWAQPNDLYSQEWGWFAVAFYNNALPDLWHNPGRG